MNIVRRFFKKSQKEQNLKIIKPYTLYPDTKIQYITEFENGYALALIARTDDNKFLNDRLRIAVLNTDYEISIYTKYHSFGRWNNGYLIAFNYSYNDNKSAVLLDKNLKEVPNLTYGWISIINHYFEVYNGSPSNSPCGLLDEKLQLILPITYSSITEISKTRFFCKGEKNIVFDAIQKITFEVDAYSISTEDENGWYKFRIENMDFGYFDNNFNIIIKPKYKSLGDFDENGYAPFTRDGVIGVIDRTGKEFVR